MKRTLLFSIAAMITGVAAAQTINSSDFGDVGESVILGTDTLPGVGPGSAGSSQVWNLTTLNTVDLDTLFFLNPATLPDGAAFPGSNLATESNQGQFFLEKTSGFVKLHGYAGGIGAAIHYNPPQTILQFPASLGTNFSSASLIDERVFVGLDLTSTCGAGAVIDSIWFKRNTELDVNVDGSGMLYLPTDTFNNSIRAYSEERSIDSVYIYAPNAFTCLVVFNIPQGWSFADPAMMQFAGFSGNPIIDTARTYSWYAPGQDFSVCVMQVNSSGNPTSATFKSDEEQLTIGLNEQGLLLSTVFPNPADNFIRISSNENLGENAIRIFDVNGRIVFDGFLNHNSALNVSALQQGLYLYRINDHQGKPLSTGRFLVSR